MSRLGQLRALKKVSDLLLIGGSAARRGPLLAHTCVIQVGDRRFLSALTPVKCCRSPDGAGPSPPPTGGSGDGRGRGSTNTSDFNMNTLYTEYFSNTVSSSDSSSLKSISKKLYKILQFAAVFVIFNILGIVQLDFLYHWNKGEE